MAICVVATLTRAVRTILRPDADSLLVPLAASIISGGLIALSVVSDARTRPARPAQWTTAVMVAAVNSLVLFIATIGIDKF